MHKDDFSGIIKFLGGMVWLVRVNATLFLVFFLYVLMFPVQLIRWIVGNSRFEATEPYRFIRFLFTKGTAFPGELPI